MALGVQCGTFNSDGKKGPGKSSQQNLRSFIQDTLFPVCRGPSADFEIHVIIGLQISAYNQIENSVFTIMPITSWAEQGHTRYQLLAFPLKFEIN